MTIVNQTIQMLADNSIGPIGFIEAVMLSQNEDISWLLQPNQMTRPLYQNQVLCMPLFMSHVVDSSTHQIVASLEQAVLLISYSSPMLCHALLKPLLLGFLVCTGKENGQHGLTSTCLSSICRSRVVCLIIMHRAPGHDKFAYYMHNKTTTSLHSWWAIHAPVVWVVTDTLPVRVSFSMDCSFHL